MRYDYSSIDKRIVAHSSLDNQLDRERISEELTNDGLTLINRDGERLLAITNDGLIIINIRKSNWYSQVIATFFRELLGKNLLVRYSRGNYRLLIYDDGMVWRDATVRYSRTDIENNIAILDLRLHPIAGLKKMSPKPKRNPDGTRIEITTQW